MQECYKVEPLGIRRKKKIMYNEIRMDINIDLYRPERVLCSTTKV